jgi:hypothetical protein
MASTGFLTFASYRPVLAPLGAAALLPLYGDGDNVMLKFLDRYLQRIDLCRPDEQWSTHRYLQSPGTDYPCSFISGV